MWVNTQTITKNNDAYYKLVNRLVYHLSNQLDEKDKLPEETTLMVLRSVMSNLAFLCTALRIYCIANFIWTKDWKRLNPYIKENVETL